MASQPFMSLPGIIPEKTPIGMIGPWLVCTPEHCTGSWLQGFVKRTVNFLVHHKHKFEVTCCTKQININIGHSINIGAAQQWLHLVATSGVPWWDNNHACWCTQVKVRSTYSKQANEHSLSHLWTSGIKASKGACFFIPDVQNPYLFGFDQKLQMQK